MKIFQEFHNKTKQKTDIARSRLIYQAFTRYMDLPFKDVNDMDELDMEHKMNAQMHNLPQDNGSPYTHENKRDPIFAMDGDKDFDHKMYSEPDLTETDGE